MAIATIRYAIQPAKTEENSQTGTIANNWISSAAPRNIEA